MPNKRRSENVQIVIGKESTFNQGQPSPDGYAFPFAQLELEKTQETGQSNIIRGDPYESQPILGMWRVRGSLLCAASLETAPRIARLIGGAIASSGASAPYTHTIKGSTNMQSIWIERWHTDAAKGDRFFGVLVTGLELAVAGRNPAPVIFNCTLLGTGAPATNWMNQSTRYDTTPDTTLLSGPFHSLADVSLLIDGAAPSADIEGVTVRITREADAIDLLDGNLYSADIVPKAYQVTADITGLWADTDSLRSLHATTKNLKVRVTKPGDATRYFEIEIPSAYLTLAETGRVSGMGPIRQRLAARGYFDSGANSSWLMTVKNDTSSYPSW